MYIIHLLTLTIPIYTSLALSLSLSLSLLIFVKKPLIFPFFRQKCIPLYRFLCGKMEHKDTKIQRQNNGQEIESQFLALMMTCLFNHRNLFIKQIIDQTINIHLQLSIFNSIRNEEQSLVKKREVIACENP
ncbi:MAG: hypothetical protein LBG80_20625 [Bacteroidales bacterium]|jgi:hypothetical protein|nr:hypothetical protein [Bacteroidales bacterium]